MSQKVITNLGKIVIVRLYEMNKTQTWLAEKCNVTPTSISLIVNGKRNPSKKLLYGISKNLNIPYEDILTMKSELGDY